MDGYLTHPNKFNLIGALIILDFKWLIFSSLD